MSASIFEPLGPGRYLPTQLAVGPWDPGALHGGPVAALVAGELQQAIVDADLGTEFVPSRLTVELQRPVPVEELTVQTVLRRPGRRICLADATLVAADGTTVLTATLQGIRRRPFEHASPAGLPVPPGPDEGVGLGADTMEGPDAFHRTGVEHRFVRGSGFEEIGPATDWIRLAVPLIADRETTPLQRVAAAADFGNGVSRLFDFERTLFLNPDLTVQLFRLPVGEWICLDARTLAGDEGVGLAESVLYDEQGCIGRATQLLLLEPR